MRRFGATLAAAALAAAGCDLTRDPTPFGPVDYAAAVHALLRAEGDTARVLISRANADDPFDDFDPVSGAAVAVSGPFGEAPLREAASGMGRCATDLIVGPVDEDESTDAEAGCYAAVLPTAVRVGERYGLHIALPDGAAATGATVVPPFPVVAAGTEEDRRLRVPGNQDADPDGSPAVLRVSWTREDADAMTQVDYSTGHAFVGDAVVEEAECGVSYTFRLDERRPAGEMWVLRVDGAYCTIRPDPEDPNGWQPLDWDSIGSRVLVTAFDTAYSRFVEEVLMNESVSRVRASMGIEGMPGVFGSMAVVDVPVMLVRERP